jgi:hypothetical protein
MSFHKKLLQLLEDKKYKEAIRFIDMDGLKIYKKIATMEKRIARKKKTA